MPKYIYKIKCSYFLIIQHNYILFCCRYIILGDDLCPIQTLQRNRSLTVIVSILLQTHRFFHTKKINVATLATSDQSFWKLSTILIATVVVVETGCNGFNLPSPTYFIWSFFACKISPKSHQLKRVQE